MKSTEWLMPDYYPKFSCKADKCRNTCCSMWRIPVSRREYEKINSMNCDPFLKERIDLGFQEPDISSDERYRYIGYNWLGNCHLYEDGLCLLHKEKGEEYLPETCRTFPRSHKKINGQNLAVCSSACERVVELICDSENLNLQREQLIATASQEITMSDEDVETILQFQKIFANKNNTLSQNIEQICLLVNEEAYRSDSAHDADPITMAMDILRKLVNRYSLLSEYADEVCARYENDHSLYYADAKAFEDRFPDWMNFFANLLNNSMMFENFPFVDPRFDKTDAYKGLCATYGLLRFLAIGHTAEYPEKEALIDVCTALFHLVDHTPFYYNINVIVSYPALLLKL